ncbi:hypothetical protein [uncultured Sphingomonas sp.]|uniref:helix-turn-helix transcriptional regulator n=1 Tax=uncultured Sphingomonas sp. TaxID=158754 RepID=UPI0025EF09FA|nr:hypothetical protein [uncultured Sphingomonas sp.]
MRATLMASAQLPNWPARLSEDLSAAYLGVSKTTFREGWQDGRYPKPAKEGRRVLWSRVQLDRFVEAQFGIVSDNDEDGSWGDLRG